ncbi:cytochrome c oxidase assembly protein [Marinimicrococcus flavescens]|uniref:Cytochrome c oxidase assembly protein n=1 Tax=Marinimicrococcus flavescens TaxID=3031815 RepID=A0AAP4D5Y0_9PROT|nr:cytochrome c oxidase assembly protein [Marinimicrococcus flavescens]
MRPVALAAGLAALLAAWVWPLPQLGGHLFTGHMAGHMTVVAVAAPLLAVALAGSRRDPLCRLPVLASPVAASLLEFVVVWSWHAPALHDAARALLAVRVAEQVSFLAVATLLWLSSVGGNGRAGDAAGVLGLLLTSMHMTLLGGLIALAPRQLYAHAGGSGLLAPLEDQQLGGTLMLTVGGAVYLAGGLFLLARLLREDGRIDWRQDANRH